MERNDSVRLAGFNRWGLVLLGFALATQALGGVFTGQQPQPVHPGFAYQGVGGRVDIPLCPSLELHTATRNVAARINRRAPGIGNLTQPGSPAYPPPGMLSVEAVLLHEIGHAISLAHPSEEVIALGGQAQDAGIAPANRGLNGVLDAERGPDGVFGSEDDVRGDDVNLTPFPLGNDNSPFVVPSIVDNFSMTTDLSLRERPGTWPMVAYAPVANLLGLAPTQSSMMTFVSEVATRPSPDELTLLKWMEAGADGVASTEDDYRLFLYVVSPTAPLEDRPPNCITVSMVPLQSSSAGQTRYITPYLENRVYQCFGSALCLHRPVIELNNAYSWHYPVADDSNGEADYVALEPSDVEFALPTEVEVNQGVAVDVSVQVTRQGGAAFPPGTQLTVTNSNGVISCVRADDRCSPQFDLSGRTVFNAVITVDGDGTPSSGAIFINVFVPNRDVDRGRVTVVDLAETLVLDFVPSRVQLRTAGLPDILNSEAPFVESWRGRLRTSATKTSIQGGSVTGDINYTQPGGGMLFCQPSARSGVITQDGGVVVIDEFTDASGEVGMEFRYGSDGSSDPVMVEAECRFTHAASSGQTIDGFVSITTGQVLGSLTPDRLQAIVRNVSDGDEEVFVFSTLDQLGQPLAEGAELDANCTTPAGNEVLFAPVGVPTVDAMGAATLTVRASTLAGAGFVEEVACSISRDGVVKAVSLAPVLPAELVLLPTSIFLPATQQVVGMEVSVDVTVNDSMGGGMPGVPVSMTCDAASASDAGQLAPVLPTTRSTDGTGSVELRAAVGLVGRNGFANGTSCTVRSGDLSATLPVQGEALLLFYDGFGD